MSLSGIETSNEIVTRIESSNGENIVIRIESNTQKISLFESNTEYQHFFRVMIRVTIRVMIRVTIRITLRITHILK